MTKSRATGQAPCGHPGEHVIGNFIKCLWGCDELSDGVPQHVDTAEETTKPIERPGVFDVCLDSECDHDLTLTAPDGVKSCWECGKILIATTCMVPRLVFRPGNPGDNSLGFEDIARLYRETCEHKLTMRYFDSGSVKCARCGGTVK